MENGYYLYIKGVIDDDLWSGQKAFMADLLRRDEELRKYYQTNRKYFSESFTAYLDWLLEAKPD